MKHTALFICIVGALALAGCSATIPASINSLNMQNGYQQISGLWYSVARAGKLPKPPQDTAGQLHLSIPSQNWEASFVPVAKKNGVTTWHAGNAASVSTRNGVILSSRGLGDDLMSSDANDALAAMAGQGGSTGQRENHYLRDDGRDYTVVFICDYSRQNQLFIEDCKGARRDITNQYWTTQSGNPRKSRQWLSPYLGYVDILWKP